MKFRTLHSGVFHLVLGEQTRLNIKLKRSFRRRNNMSEKLNSNPENAQEAGSNSGWENLSEVPFAGNNNQVEN